MLQKNGFYQQKPRIHTPQTGKGGLGWSAEEQGFNGAAMFGAGGADLGDIDLTRKKAKLA